MALAWTISLIGTRRRAAIANLLDAAARAARLVKKRSFTFLKKRFDTEGYLCYYYICQWGLEAAASNGVRRLSRESRALRYR